MSDLLKRLLDKGLITKKGGMVILSRDGEEAYRDITLVHRAMETLLFRAGLSKEEACREVKEFDYLMSRETAERILHLMGDPDTCPHGQPVVVKE
ncbi:metal-dependent transcriptional regulator [Thermogymnomonas acidicola]|uniref:metal-dependent transcriptional regulator n=1 Tax=Thermogymnomonas acidicola TaxID=399579 RepID=UPI001396AB5E|nr:metal-dependent transcriptional regulator [Thermogymnomonas acidicola]